ncbi:MAG: RNA polymerase sigma factor [Acetobacteraceae bacterium]
MDETAFNALVRSHHQAMVRVARCFVGSHAIAEEVAQDTWLEFISKPSRFAGRSTPEGWLFPILVDKARISTEREGRIADFTALEGDLAASVGPARFAPDGNWAERSHGWDERNPERITAGRQLMAHVADLLHNLPAAQRNVVVLSDFHGRTPEDACRILGITAANQRVLLHRGRSRIRNGLTALLARTPGHGPFLSREAI